jgi:hypothetical protein
LLLLSNHPTIIYQIKEVVINLSYLYVYEMLISSFSLNEFLTMHIE